MSGGGGESRHWTQSKVRLASHYQRDSDFHADWYGQIATNTKRWSDRIQISTGILGLLVGVDGVLITFGNNNGDTPFWVKVLIIVGGFLISALLTVAGVFRLEETSQCASRTSTSFQNLARNINHQLMLDASERTNGREFLKSTYAEISTLLLTAPRVNSLFKPTKRPYHYQDNQSEISAIHSSEIVTPMGTTAVFQGLVNDTWAPRPAERTVSSNVLDTVHKDLFPDSDDEEQAPANGAADPHTPKNTHMVAPVPPRAPPTNAPAPRGPPRQMRLASELPMG